MRALVQLASASLAAKAVSLVWLGFLARYLAKPELAILPVYEMIEGLAPVLFAFGIQPTVLRELPGLLQREPARARGLIYTSSLILAGSSLLFAAGVALLAEPLAARLFHDPAAASLLRITASGFLFFGIRTHGQFVLWSASRFDQLAILRVAASTNMAVLGFGLVMLWGVRGLAVALALNDFILLLLTLFFLRPFLRRGRIEWYPAGRLVRVSLPFYFESLLTYFRSQGDNLIVATFLGPVVVSIYYIARRIPQLLLMLMESLDKVVTAEIAAREQDRPGMADYIRRLEVKLAHTAVPAMMLLIGMMPLIIHLWAGPGYAAAVAPAMILSAVQMVGLTQVPLARGIFIALSPMRRVLQTVVETALLIPGLLLLTPPLAARGVALARLLAVVGAWAFAWRTLRGPLALGLPWRRLALSLGASAAMTATIIGLLAWRPSLVAMPVYGIAGVAVFLALILATDGPAFRATLASLVPPNLAARGWPWRRRERSGRDAPRP